MVLNLFLNLLHSWCEALFCTMCFPSLLQICILPVPRRQPTPGDSVMGRKVAFQCDVDVLMMVHAAWEQPCFPSILPRYLMATIFTAFDLAAYIYKLKWLVNKMHTHLHCQYVQTLFSIAQCSIVLGPAAFLCRPAAAPETTCSMHDGVLMWCNHWLHHINTPSCIEHPVPHPGTDWISPWVWHCLQKMNAFYPMHRHSHGVCVLWTPLVIDVIVCV